MLNELSLLSTSIISEPDLGLAAVMTSRSSDTSVSCGCSESFNMRAIIQQTNYKNELTHSAQRTVTAIKICDRRIVEGFHGLVEFFIVPDVFSFRSNNLSWLFWK